MKIRRICCLNNLGMTPPAAGSSYGMKMTLLSFGNIILLKEKGWGEGMRKSIPRQVTKKFRVPKKEKKVWGSPRRRAGSRIHKEEELLSD